MTSEAPMTDAFARGASQPVASPPSTPPTQPTVMELEEDGRRLERMKVPRRELPKLFEEPVRDQPVEPR